MPFGAHETMEVHEILNEKIHLINLFGRMAHETENHQLRQMIERHLQTAVEAYDQMVAYTHDYGAANRMPQVYGMPRMSPEQVQYGLHNPAPMLPQPQQAFRDQQIASALLLAHKNSAKNHMAASLECADPNLRQMMVNGAITCSNQAYEVFLLMNENGLYQVPTMNDHTAKTFLHAYQPTNSQPMMHI
ncbi:spore coat protein [Xylanibacillus composti]|uniref:Coat protein F n=1 Tax=Xylanibacillus composti TaxID=1572762 RepID=A0A8J4M255_9BACL|nr:spore coat protein [Xylanibacillus composti]MDT9724930.1 spore coat protein [Xylanibacillus composti]GIQ68166.1 coat protein F [Xylanibacillus composti]